MRKWSALLIVIGGIIALVAFFLPFGWVSAGNSLYGYVRQQGPRSEAVWSLSVEPLAIVALMVFGLLSFRRRRAAYILSLLSALLGLESLVYMYSYILGLFSVLGAGLLSLQYLWNMLRLIIQYVEIGTWLAGAGFLLGLIGAIVGLSRQPASEPALEMSQQRTLPLRLGNVLAFCAGVAAIIAFLLVFFLPQPSVTRGSVSLPLSWQQVIILSLLFGWPVLLGAFLLIVWSVLAIRVRKTAALWMLSGAMLGLVFLLDFVVVSYIANSTGVYYNHNVSAGVWLALTAFIVGVIGALLELRRRPAAVLMAAAAGQG